MQENLFQNSKITKSTTMEGLDSSRITHHSFLESESTELFYSLKNKIQWQQDRINIMGKLIDIPRLTAWYGVDGKSYTYSGIKMNPHRLTSELQFIKEKIEKVTSSKFNSVLLNLYRDGNDSVDWHSDNEKELNKKADIASG